LYNKENVRIGFQVTDQCADGEREEVYFFVLRVKFGVTYANGRNVWPLLQESLAVFAAKRGEFYRGNTKKLQESLAVMT